MSKPSSESKQIAKAAAAAFNGPPNVFRHWDADCKASVDIVSCKDSPCLGVTSYATIGVSHVPLKKGGKELKVRAELVGACASQFSDFANCLSTAAFCVINSGWFVAPGIIFPDVLAMYRDVGAMRHFLFLPPFLWEDRLRNINLQNNEVAWLLAVPISQDELRFAESRGVPALEELFEKRQIDIFDLNRKSVAPSN